MNINSKTILKTAAVYSALMVLVGGAWAFGDKTGYRPWLLGEQNKFTTEQFQLVMDQSQQNTQAVLSLEFWRLDDQRKLGNLDDEKFQKYCQIAQLLRYFKVPDCRFNPEVTVTLPQPLPGE